MSEQLRLQAGTSSASIDLVDGGRLTSLTAGGVELLGGVEDAGVIGYGSFLMAPWAGRIRHGVLDVDGTRHQLPLRYVPPHAGHGMVLEQPWRVRAVSDTAIRIVADIDSAWPWPGTVVQDIALRPDGIRMRAEVHANDEPFPAAFGWHPWLRTRLDRDGQPFGERATLTLHADGMLLRDADGIPDGTVVPVPAGPLVPGKLDDCFTGVHWPITMTWPGALRLDIDSDCTYAVVFDERDAVWCVEPQTGPPDAPNLEPRWVRPGEPLIAWTDWTWTPLG